MGDVAIKGWDLPCRLTACPGRSNAQIQMPMNGDIKTFLLIQLTPPNIVVLVTFLTSAISRRDFIGARFEMQEPEASLQGSIRGAICPKERQVGSWM